VVRRLDSDPPTKVGITIHDWRNIAITVRRAKPA
jgi:hypothetical protein